MENGPVEIVDLPIKNGNFPQLCQPLPEAIDPILKPPSPDSPLTRLPCALSHLGGDHRETSKLFIRVALALDQVIHLAKARVKRAHICGWAPSVEVFFLKSHGKEWLVIDDNHQNIGIVFAGWWF